MERGNKTNTTSYRQLYDYDYEYDYDIDNDEDDDDGQNHNQRMNVKINGGKEEMTYNKNNNNNGMESSSTTTSNNSNSNNCSNSNIFNRRSELTIAFEGEVYVFPAVTPHQVQAVLLLLGGADTASNVPSSEFLPQQNAVSVGDSDTSQGSKLSRRLASLVRFREKRKERCFDKKIRYNCRKEVAQRMHRKNGQFASLKDCYDTDTGNNWETNKNPQSESTLRKCQHCGIIETATPAMRRGPAGPRTLCNACGLMWANKGTLRDLTKGGRHVSFDQTELGTPDFKLSTMEQENPFVDQDEEGSPEEIKPVPLNFENSKRPNDLSLPETDEAFPLHVENSSVNLDDEDFQDTLDGLGNVSSSEFEIPENFDDQIMVF